MPSGRLDATSAPYGNTLTDYEPNDTGLRHQHIVFSTVCASAQSLSAATARRYDRLVPSDPDL